MGGIITVYRNCIDQEKTSESTLKAVDRKIDLIIYHQQTGAQRYTYSRPANVGLINKNEPTVFWFIMQSVATRSGLMGKLVPK